MERLANVSLKMFGREYDLAFGRQPSGVNWLMAINKETGTVLPLTATEGQSTPANVVYAFDMADIVPSLESAGIIQRSGLSKVNFGFNLCKCEIVHAGLIERLSELETKQAQVASEIEMIHELEQRSR